VRKVTRDLNEDVRDSVRALANTDAFQQSRRERKKVEMRFAHMKRILRLDRLRLRGLSGARDEVLLTATAQNLRRLVKLLGRAPPVAAAAERRRYIGRVLPMQVRNSPIGSAGRRPAKTLGRPPSTTPSSFANAIGYAADGITLPNRTAMTLRSFI